MDNRIEQYQEAADSMEQYLLIDYDRIASSANSVSNKSGEAMANKGHETDY